MVLFGIIIFILAIGLLSSQISTIKFNRVAIIVLLLSGVLAFHAMWVGQLGSGVGIFNGLFQVTAVTLGIDLFIYIVNALVLLISETQVQKYRLNKEEPASSGFFERRGTINRIPRCCPLITLHPGGLGTPSSYF